MTMKRIAPALALFALCFPAGLRAQLAQPPNEAGVTMGQWGLYVRDMEASRKFWTTIGGSPAGKLGEAELIKFPNAFIALNPTAPSGPSEGSVTSHVTFQVPNTAEARDRLTAAGLAVDTMNFPRLFLTSPDGVHIEILEDKTMTVPVRSHHVHWYVTEAVVPEIQRWYVERFGAKAGMRGNFQAADIPGQNLTFSPSPMALAPTKGRAINHVGFEVKNLEAFCNKLGASGIKFDRAYARSGGIGSALLTDPWGTTIELTEGLSSR